MEKAVPSSNTVFQATRRRLALWYTAVTAVLLLVFATVVYGYVRDTLIDRVDDTLSHVVEVVERSLVLEQADNQTGWIRLNLDASFRDNAEFLEDDHIDLEWFSPMGEKLWSTLPASASIPLRYERNVRTVPVKSDGVLEKEAAWLRQITEPVRINGQMLGYLRVSHPWFEVTKPTRQLLLELSLGLVVMISTVAVCGWLLSGLAMKPVRESYQRLRQFTADASHELRNPIAVIQTNTQVALMDLDMSERDWDTQKHQLEVIERLTRRLGRLVEDLLFLARSDSGIQQNSQLCNLEILLKDIVEEQQITAESKQIKLSLQIAPLSTVKAAEPVACYACCGDRDQLARLFTNLVSNALQHTPTGGEVGLSLQRSGQSQMQIQVSDTGSGISPEALPHIFNRFYRVDTARSHKNSEPANSSLKLRPAPTGTGLGLAIAQAIVENHHGQIRVDSTLHQGTTFTVTLPLARESA
ncbi:cell wall metabolism sensor histidine kinase WalK [Leptolyngbya sp. FACHB-261]|uniref:sensor histidine kinase n=1 Tax=Leptolyngbya sp. FACHB-261 TaxID=2692806 RepID=UPI00168251E5|nr:HAMP domain-containing sensor histidine kinase [Leptolyngbya sp. FACHB-261]MBD2103277.1 HAMP domain-containing histidine kinase [Leptolyngbya sp. FACHB-261]